MSGRRERGFDRTVKIKPGEKILLVDGDDEVFLTRLQAGILVEDARGFRISVETERLMGRGRGRGIGLTMITQRSAVLNKDVLTQADVLLAMRTTGPQDVKAIEAWISKHADTGDQVVASLPSLETGEAWVWNPERGLLELIGYPQPGFVVALPVLFPEDTRG